MAFAAGSAGELPQLPLGDSLDSFPAVEEHESLPRGEDLLSYDLPHRPLTRQDPSGIVIERRLAGSGGRDRGAALVECADHIGKHAGSRGPAPPEFENAAQKLHLAGLRQRLRSQHAIENIVVGPDPRSRTGKPIPHPDLDADVFERVEERVKFLKVGGGEDLVKHRDGGMRRFVQSKAPAQVGSE